MNIEPANQRDACSKQEFSERFNDHCESYQRLLVKTLEADFADFMKKEAQDNGLI